jgi:hypothetical protein
MKKIDHAVAIVVRNIQSDDSPNETNLALSPRHTPLTATDCAKLSRHAKVQFKTEWGPIKPLLNAYGTIYDWEWGVKPIGCALELLSNDSRVLPALKRPTTPLNTMYHFTRLAATKRNTKGDAGFQIMLEDLAYDLRDCSEWAIIETCSRLRLDSSPFFPDYSFLVQAVRELNAAVMQK